MIRKETVGDLIKKLSLRRLSACLRASLLSHSIRNGIAAFLLVLALMSSHQSVAQVIRGESEEDRDPARIGEALLDLELGVGSWIWTAENPYKQRCRLWKSFEVPSGATVVGARLRMTADNGYRLLLDGQALGRGSDWRWISEYDLRWVLTPGQHTLAVEVFNDALEGGLLAGLRIDLADGSVIEIVSDATWYVVPDDERGWEKRVKARAHWKPALVVGAVGSFPWEDGNRGIVNLPPVMPSELHFWQAGWFLILLLSIVAVAVLMSLRLAAKLTLQSKARQVLQRERARIARDIHDDIGAGLTQLVLEGEVAQTEFPEGSTARVRFSQICEKARSVSHSLEEVVWAVNSRHDSVRDFASYVCKYAQTFLQTTPIRCRLDVEAGMPSIALDLPVRRNLFLAVKEALNNAAKHSGANELHLRIRRQGQTLVVGVEDNGRGFEPGSLVAERNGLLNMEERMREAGGSFSVHSHPGKGCQVEFRIAVPAGRRSGCWDGQHLMEADKTVVQSVGRTGNGPHQYRSH